MSTDVSQLENTSWEGLAPCDHLVHIYEDEGVFIDGLAAYVRSGFEKGEVVVVIATSSHASSLELNLRGSGIDCEAATHRGDYIVLDAAATLSRFMRDGWPDAALFQEVVREVIAPARLRNKPVRAFGEMVVLLWSQGLYGATIVLEQLWNVLCKQEELALLCAYPRIGSRRLLDKPLREVCDLHTGVVDSRGEPSP